MQKFATQQKNPLKLYYLMLNPHTKSLIFFVFFLYNFCSKNFSTAPLTLRFSQLISVGQKSSVTNSGVKQIIFKNFTFFLPCGTVPVMDYSRPGTHAVPVK